MSAQALVLPARALRPLRQPSRRARVETAVTELLRALDLDLGDPHLRNTPGRMARAYEELLSGLRPGAQPRLRTFPNPERYAQPVAVTGIAFHSLCAHHFLPFFGVAHVAYVPAGRVVGLSKLARVVEHFARRPQVQERLTEQVTSFLHERLRPAGVVVVMQARHLCMEMRGVRKSDTLTTTRSVRGDGGTLLHLPAVFRG